MSKSRKPEGWLESWKIYAKAWKKLEGRVCANAGTWPWSMADISLAQLKGEECSVKKATEFLRGKFLKPTAALVNQRDNTISGNLWEPSGIQWTENKKNDVFWRLAHSALPLGYRLVHAVGSENGDCPHCQGTLQTIEHFTLECDESYAYVNVTHKWREIITKAINNIRDSLNSTDIDKNEEGKRIIASMEELINQIQSNDKLIQIEDDGRPDIITWNDVLNTYFKNENWHTATWLFTESLYLVYLALYEFLKSVHNILVGHCTKYWLNYDPYFRQKEDAFKLSFSEIFEFSKHIDELISSSKETIDDDNKIFYDLAHKSLWGNATDLSMLPNFGTNNKVEIKQSKSEKTILVNDLEKAWKWLSKYSNSRVDFIHDNADKYRIYWVELYIDLIFSDWLIQSGYVSEVHFHVKSFPCYVSDTSLDDFNWLLKTLKSNDFFSSASEIEKSSLKKLVNQKVPDLYADLCKSHLVIFKGDLNYRRLVYDCKWETTTSFKEAISPLANSKNTLPLLSLRTGKSDVFVGLDEGVEERLGPDRSWMYSRKYAVIQFSEGNK
ncbi:hypothetical protein C2G38_2197373 [Gigaspora rosea]|uniref:Sugar phosphate phosphatase n=1 Tax=Gigaspora rosea TaxID=44941 RepID=A0A397UWR0_9GLOM|nr:hypothetical protein C2G38_2197373 [Gigaspora rosea]